MTPYIKTETYLLVEINVQPFNNNNNDNNKNYNNNIIIIDIHPRGIKVLGWHPVGDSYASWSGWDL